MSGDGFKYPLPTASPYVDLLQYIPLVLSAIEVELDRRDVWFTGDEDTALGYIEDLKHVLGTLPEQYLSGELLITDSEGGLLTDFDGFVLYEVEQWYVG